MIPAPNTTLSVTVADGKYTVEQDASGRLYAKRYGEMWRPLTGDGLALALAQAVEAERERSAELLKALKSVTAEVETFHIDWSRLNSGSPDYDPNYKPDFPECVLSARTAIDRAETLPGLRERMRAEIAKGATQ